MACHGGMCAEGWQRYREPGACCFVLAPCTRKPGLTGNTVHLLSKGLITFPSTAHMLQSAFSSPNNATSCVRTSNFGLWNKPVQPRWAHVNAWQVVSIQISTFQKVWRKVSQHLITPGFACRVSGVTGEWNCNCHAWQPGRQYFEIGVHVSEISDLVSQLLDN